MYTKETPSNKNKFLLGAFHKPSETAIVQDPKRTKIIVTQQMIKKDCIRLTHRNVDNLICRTKNIQKEATA